MSMSGKIAGLPVYSFILMPVLFFPFQFPFDTKCYLSFYTALGSVLVVDIVAEWSKALDLGSNLRAQVRILPMLDFFSTFLVPPSLLEWSEGEQT